MDTTDANASDKADVAGSPTGQAAPDQANIILEELLRSRPWDTLVYKLLRFTRRWIVTIVGLSLLAFMRSSLGDPASIALLLPLIWMDHQARTRAWDFRVSEASLVTAIVYGAAIEKYPNEQTTSKITRQCLVLCGVYGALAIFTYVILAFLKSGINREMLMLAFAAAGSVLSIATAFFLSVHASAILVMQHKGVLNSVAKVEERTSEPPDLLSPLAVLPKRIRREIMALFTLLFGLLFMSSHAFILAAVIYEPRYEIRVDTILFSPVVFVFLLGAVWLMVAYPIIYMAYKVAIEVARLAVSR